MSATLKRIAELTGVSIRSVNRALQGAAGLSEAKRKRILDTASALGYTPNIAARNLRLRRNNFVGIVVPGSGLRSESFLSVTSRKINALQLLLERAGYFTLFGVNTGKPDDLRKLLEQWTGLVSTVIFFSWNRKWKGQDIVGQLPLQYIFVDLESDFGHHMVIDRAPGIYDGIRFLLDRGCSRLARCGNVASRDAGFNAALQDLSGRSITHHHYPAACNFEEGFRIGNELTAKHFDAVFFDLEVSFLAGLTAAAFGSGFETGLSDDGAGWGAACGVAALGLLSESRSILPIGLKACRWAISSSVFVTALASGFFFSFTLAKSLSACVFTALSLLNSFTSAAYCSSLILVFVVASSRISPSPFLFFRKSTAV